MRRRFKPYKPKRVQPKYRANEQIKAYVVSVIDDEGNQLGEMQRNDAIAMAKERYLDLVEVAPNAQPPVCKFSDYGKLQYNESKQVRLRKAKQKKAETKGIRIGVRTDTHDLEFKTKQAEKFLTKGNKVKIEIVLRGREKAHQDLARENLKNFLSQISVEHKVEEEIKRFPGGFNTIIAPE